MHNFPILVSVSHERHQKRNTGAEKDLYANRVPLAIIYSDSRSKSFDRNDYSLGI